jgi:NTP pyrophosphatase (non-canonical NTP hydrolase)
MTIDDLPRPASLADLQAFIHQLEAFHGWLDVDLVHNVFLMVEEVGELAKALRKYEKIFGEAAQGPAPSHEAARQHVGEEIVDVMNYLLAIANRLGLDLEASFREKNALNLTRRWG